MTEQSHQPRTFADAVVRYVDAGWPCIIPVPADTKYPPPSGFTGAEGRDTDPVQLVQWATGHTAGHSIALRMPDGIIGIDVDQYLKAGKQKRGAETLARLVEQWGPLPATWTSTAREADGPSRIHFYRVPAQRYATVLKAVQADGTETGDIEIIQRHHRYAVVWPSPHSELGSAVYTWYDPQGHPSLSPPRPEDFALLPSSWVSALAEGAASAGPPSADRASGATLLDQLLEDWRPECADITSARMTAIDLLTRAESGSRHDVATERTHALVQLAAQGHTGVAYAINELRATWAVLTEGEDRAEEFERMLLTSARKAVSVVGVTQMPRDPCYYALGFPVTGAVPDDDRPASPENAPVEGIDPGRFYSVREAIGTHSFDPNAGHDQNLAEAVLARMYPALRYAYDSGSWLIRVPERWEERRDLGGWAVAQLAPLMPAGDKEAEKGSEAHERDKRKARLMGAPGAKAVASKIDALVKGGTHPASVRLGALDSDPEVLWAGGMPYSLRLSHDGPTWANIDPATPHLHAAGVTPEDRPTPAWDAFLAAVWPDPELRAWAIRVLSIALTGYADRALPVLLGETGRGKTQVVHLLMSVLGSYAHAANPKLLNSGSNEHDTIVYALKGRRLSFIDEAPSEAKAGQERLKQLTGGGQLTARQMNRDPITFSPTHTLVLTANDEPVLTDPAIRSRARLIPCEGDPDAVRAARAAIGHVAGVTWRQEAPGVLASMMREAARWLAEPSTAAVTSAPESIRYLAEHLGAEQDPVAVWVAEETEHWEPGTASRELYQAFTASCLRNNMRRDAIPSETKWGRALNRLGFPSWHTGTGKRRPLRVRPQGFLPGMDPVTGSGHTTGQGPLTQETSSTPSELGSTPETGTRDGMAGSSDGLVNGSQQHPSQDFSQVNPSESVSNDECDGSRDPLTHMRAPTHAQGERPGSGAQPGTQSVGGSAPKSPKPKSEEATKRAAEKRAATRAAKVAEAAGPTYGLPAVLTRDLVITSASSGLTLADVDALLGTITTKPADHPGAELTVDVEHTGYPVGHRDYALRTIQLGNEAFAVVLDASDPDQAEVAGRHLRAATVLHAHSATADLVPLAHAGLIDADEAWAKMLDTAILAKLADPSMTDNNADLKGVSKAVLGPYGLATDAEAGRKALFKAGGWLTDTEVTTAVERSGWAQVDHRTETMIRYDGADVLDDAALARALPKPAPAVLERETLAQRMTARVAHRGLQLDGDQVEALRRQHLAARAEHFDAVRDLSGGRIENPGSNPQVGEALTGLGAQLPRTATNKPSVAKDVLEPLRAAEGPIGALASAVLDYRHHDTALGTFLEPWRQLVEHGDGRARPTVYTLGADTGRMSCVRPNFQQVPRAGGFRPCITADPGHLLISADFSNVELRVAAALSQDRGLMQMMVEGVDFHWMVARQAWGPDATKAQRYIAKRGVFGRIYGGGVPTLAKQMGVTEPVAQQVVDALDALTPGLSEWSRMVREAVKAGHAMFPTYTGRVIHLTGDFPHKAPNYAIQGTARELLVDALVRWSQTRWGGATLLPVHDELVVMVPEDEAEDATAALIDSMTNELGGVAIVVEADTPTYAWQDAT